MPATPESVLEFWFNELTSKDHFTKSDALDEKIDDRFRATHTMLISDLGEAKGPGDFSNFHPWTQSAEVALAAIIVLDQFSRNIFRDTSAAFGSDGPALALAKLCLEKGWDMDTPMARRSFVYMPFMHSENAADQAKCVTLFKTLDGENSEDFAVRHQIIIDRFGRFPHRNEILGRVSTPQEQAFLNEPNSSF